VIGRRKFGIGIALSVLAYPFAAWAQRPSKVYRIGYLSLRVRPAPGDEFFVQALRELGYVEGSNLIIEYRWAAEDLQRLPSLAAELVALNVDVIVTSTTPPAKAVKAATNTIPIIMVNVADPVSSGLVASLGHPGGNVTGLTSQTTDLTAKQLQLVHEILPRATRIGLLALDGSPLTPLTIAAMKAGAQAMNLEVATQLVTKPDELRGAFAKFQKAGVHALIVQLNALTMEQGSLIVEMAAEYRLPAMYETRRFVDNGGLVSYGPDTPIAYRRAAIYVDKIFKGARPEDLPIEQPTKFEFVINLRTAKALGINVPQALLLRADEVIR
jgi:putative ABC transport system substrate-binding protein